MRPRAAWMAIVAALAAIPAMAHPIDAYSPHDAPGWTLDAWVTGPLALSAVLFGLGWLRLRRRSSGGRSSVDRKAVLFTAGWIALAAAAVSPLHEAGERAFAAHMLEHELLMLVAAPLLVLSWPIATMLWALPAGWRQGLAAAGRWPGFLVPWRALSDPIVATLVQAAALWIWHMPALFDLALRSEAWHAAQHLCFLVSALFFWTAMLNGRRGRKGVGLAALCLFLTSAVSGALGAFMALSQSPWYARYAALGMTPWGLTPAEDQQLAGLLMWIPGGLVHAGAALVLIAGALRLAGPEPRGLADASTS